MNDAVQKTRAARAAAIACALVLAVPVSGALASAGASPPEEEAKQAGIDANALIGDGDAFGFLERAGELCDGASAGLPADLEGQLALPPGAYDVRADATGGIVGCLVDGNAEDVLGDLSRQMEGAGWRVVPLGDATGATFMREEGPVTWVLATATQVGPSVNVVYRCVVR